MYAHTDAIRSYGATTDDLGADITTVATRMSALPAAAVEEAFGAVGARFAAALGEACSRLSDDVAAMGARLTAAGAASAEAARRYDDAEDRARAQIGDVGI